MRRACGLLVSCLLMYAIPAGAETPGGTTARSAQTSEWGPIDLKSKIVEPGTKAKFTFAAERSFEGSFLDTALWAARGASPGPTLCAVAGIHGDEINSVEIARASFHAIDPKRLAGTVIVVPAANSQGFRTMNRYMVDRRESQTRCSSGWSGIATT